MRAWDVLEERRAILRGKPGSLTGRVDAEPKRKPRAPRSTLYSQDLPADPTAQPPPSRT